MRQFDSSKPNPRRKGGKANAPTVQQREGLAHPSGLRPRNPSFHQGSVVDANRRDVESGGRSGQRPAWMADASLLPKKPPRRAEEG